MTNATGIAPHLTPEYLFWYGCQRYILYLRVLVFEQTDDGEWRLMRELKPFRTHVRHEGPVGKLIAKARRIADPLVRQFYMPAGTFEIGQTTIEYCGDAVRTYDLERLLIETARMKDAWLRVGLARRD